MGNWKKWLGVGAIVVTSLSADQVSLLPPVAQKVVQLAAVALALRSNAVAKPHKVKGK